MTKITDLFSEEDLAANLTGGYVRFQTHPEFENLRILNYTEMAQFAREWNDVTRVCRGLIYDADTLEVIARPFPKIHNWDEAEAPSITWDAPLYSWSNKEDGSLGIIYLRPDGLLSVATRGSFESDQALHARALLETHDTGDWWALIGMGYTPLVEIVYPDNRIVLDYGGADRRQGNPRGVAVTRISLDEAIARCTSPEESIKAAREYAGVGDLSHIGGVYQRDFEVLLQDLGDVVPDRRLGFDINQSSVNSLVYAMDEMALSFRSLYRVGVS